MISLTKRYQPDFHNERMYRQIYRLDDTPYTILMSKDDLAPLFQYRLYSVLDKEKIIMVMI